MGRCENAVASLKQLDRSLLVQRVSLFGVVASSATLSYSVLAQRAAHIGFPDWATFFYPIGLDALILGASRVWTNTSYSKVTRGVAAGITMAAIVAGLLGFVAEFWSGGWIAVTFACLVPSSLAASLILTSLVSTDRGNDRDPEPKAEQEGTSRPRVSAKQTSPDGDPGERVVRESLAGTAAATAVAFPDDSSTLGPAPADERRAWIAEQLDNGVKVSGADVDRAFPGSGRNGARLVREVTQDRENDKVA